MTTTRPNKSLLTVSAFALVALGASAASAQQPQPGCPPGSWFCADTQVQPAAPAGQPVAPQTLQPLPQQQPVPVAPQQPPTVVYQNAPPTAPPVVVYQPAPPPVVVVRQPEYRGYYYRPVQAGPPYRQSEWGLNLRFDGAVFGANKNGDGGMGGVGAGLRYKMSPYFGLEGGVDWIVGRDYNSMRRAETAFSLTGMLFVNPRSRAQVYFLGGINYSIARVTDDTAQPLAGGFGFANDPTYTYNYFGGQFGIGMEFRVSRVLALNLDVRGVIRNRTDDYAKTHPEFNDGNGRTTNTSGGAVFTGGMTFYF
jgi:hypothetical protein